MEQPLINKVYLLEKIPGKGGWVYAAIPEVLQDKNSPFGWVKVKGEIDGHPLRNIKLMPMGNGKLFFPIKSELRKKIGKQEGDYIHIILYADIDPLEIPDELLLCLIDNPSEHKTFLSYPEGAQKEFIDWIFSAKTDTTKVNRIAQTLDMLGKGLKLSDKE